MKKNKKNEKELLANAALWFKQKYGKTPKECGIQFIKVWHKPIPLQKSTAVVFAKTEKKGNAFIWEQNAILRSIKYLWVFPIFFIVTFFAAFSQDTNEAMYTISGFALAVYLCALLFFIYLGAKAKKLEQIHQWDVDVYYS